MKEKKQGQEMGEYLATRMATQKPMTKQQMLRKWPRLRSVSNINHGINWIEANTATSNNPFLFIWDRGSAIWGYRDSFGEVRLNLKWNLRYLQTRMGTFQKVIDHSISSPVVAMTPNEVRAAKSVAAQAGGVAAYIETMAEAL